MHHWNLQSPSPIHQFTSYYHHLPNTGWFPSFTCISSKSLKPGWISISFDNRDVRPVNLPILHELSFLPFLLFPLGSLLLLLSSNDPNVRRLFWTGLIPRDTTVNDNSVFFTTHLSPLRLEWWRPCKPPLRHLNILLLSGWNIFSP